MIFKNRLDAAKQLMPFLQKYRREDCIVLAVPRGGVPIGHYLAQHLGCPLDLLLTKKIGHPYNPEYAIGAVTLEDYTVEENIDLPDGYIEGEVARIRKALNKVEQQFQGEHQPLELKNKTIIIVDDGIATGRTLKATITLLRRKNPKRLIVAVPVAPQEVAQEFRKLADDFICLHTPSPFIGVGAFYYDFRPTKNSDVVHMMHDLKGGKVAA